MKSILLLSLLLPTMVFAQPNENLMYSSGRIYVVIAVMLTILAGLVFYLLRIERKLKKMEQNEL